MLESYITPILMGYINKYVKNIKPSDLQVSFWGGDAVLRNLELRLDVLEKELRYPLTIRSGRIRELVLHLPWNAILSKPVEVQLKDVEIVIKLKAIRLKNLITEATSQEETTELDPASASSTGKGEEMAPKDGSDDTQQGYLQGYTSRILNNLRFHVQNLVVKVIEEESDLMMSFNIQSLKYGMTDEHWAPSYICTDYCSGNYSLNKVLDILDMVVHMQPIDSSNRVQPSTALKDPFLKKCSFSVRIQSLHQGKKLLNKSTCFLFDSLVFSADENQFSLFFHHLDWLLAMYYDGKKLKGRDDDLSKFKSLNPEPKAGVVIENDGPTSQDAASSFEDVLLVGSIEDVGAKSQEGVVGEGEGGRGGWGSWMWSFVAAEEADGEAGGEGGKIQLTLAESSTISFLAKSITVNLKVTHQGRVPVFSTPRSRSRTVLNIIFSGCSARVDSVPSTQLFTVSLGIMAVQAAALGFCSCSDATPSSWKADPHHEKVPVFSLGDTATCDTELVLKGSLFDPETPASFPDHLPLAEFLLAPRPEFTALWFTYEYYDTGPAHPCEVCEERLLVGELKFLLSPDTLHRITHFTSAFTESLKACPLFTDGMVIIGDPKAETSLKVTLAGGQVILGSNVHYLSCSSSNSNDQSKSKTSAVKVQPSLPASSESLPPLLTVSLARSTISMTSAMYSGNASPEVPQRNQIRLTLYELEVIDDGEFSLSSSNQTNQTTTKKKIINVPKLEVYSHSKTTGDGKKMNENDSLYTQLHVEELSCTVSVEQISKSSLVALSWYTGLFPTPHPKPLPPEANLGGHLHVSIKELELTKSVMVAFTFISLTVDSMGAVLLCDSTKGRLCHAIPVFYGPLPTIHWNTIDAYNNNTVRGHACQGDGNGKIDESYQRMLEIFTATPHQDSIEKSYPTLQLSVGGLTACLDPIVLDFMKHVPSLIVWDRADYGDQGLAGKSLIGGGGGGGGGEGEGVQPSLHSEDTAKEDTTGLSNTTESIKNSEDIITKLKSYATKVEVQPILIIFPSTPLEEGLMSSELPEFPVLPTLRENSTMEALLLCLPELSLTSAKSHVLEEPVPKNSSTSTFPWDCTLKRASVVALLRGGGVQPHYVVDPLNVAVSLADQQGGTGVAVHTDSIAVTLSRNNVELLSRCASEVLETISVLSSSKSPDGCTDSGVHSLDDPLPLLPPPSTPSRRHPSHISSPALSTITTATVTTLPAHTSLGATSSSSSSLYSSNTFSSLWVQIIVTKITLSLLAPLPTQESSTRTNWSTNQQSISAQSKSSSTASYTTPLSSPTMGMSSPMGAVSIHIHTPCGPMETVPILARGPTETMQTHVTYDAMKAHTPCGNDSTGGNANERPVPGISIARFSSEIEGVSIQFDVQEKYANLIVKVSSVGATLKTKNYKDSETPLRLSEGEGCGEGQWIPYLSSEKVFSSKGSALPDELSEILANSSSAAIHLPQGHTVSANSFRNFITLEYATPRQSLHRAPALRLKIQSFEAVLWLPIVDMISQVFESLQPKVESEPARSEVTQREDRGEGVSWPTVEATVECCRLVLPSADYSDSVLCNIGCVTVSHSLDYPTTDVRYIISNSAFRRLSHLSGEKKQPPLPAYQLDLLAMSIWGIHRDEERQKGQVLLYAGSSDIRMIYTPALYWRPTVAGTSHKPAILACGHCLEINFRTDLDLMLGSEQVKCISTVLQTNKISTLPKQTTPLTIPTNLASSPGVPFKGLLSGTAVRLTLVSSLLSTNEEGGEGGGENLIDSASETSEFVFPTLHGFDSEVVPLAQLQLFNILCSVTTSSSGSCLVEGSCFNMAVGYCGGDHMISSYSDLVDIGITSSLMDTLLLETRRGHAHNKREIPPSVVTVAIDLNPRKPPAVNVVVGRPIKIILTPQLIGKFSEFGDSILRHTGGQYRTESSSLKPEPVDEGCLVTFSDSKTSLPDSYSNQDGSVRAYTTGMSESHDIGLKLKLKIMQILVEYQITSRCLDHRPIAEDDNLRMSGAGGCEGVEGGGVSEGCVAEEGFLFVWDHLDLAYPNVSGSSKSVSGELHLEGLQLLSIRDCSTNIVLLPTQLNCALTKHFPSSQLDLGYMTVHISCGLLDIRLSREEMELVNKVHHQLAKLFPHAHKMESEAVEEEMEVEKKEEKEEKEQEDEKDVVNFHDDLRAGDFTYVRDSDVVADYSLRPGEVYFSLGGGLDRSTSMSWYYHEPRAVTKLSILPVPFSFTSESDAPIQIKVGCSLDYWNEDRESFSVLQKFHLTETTPTEVDVSRVIGSRKWRISIVEVEWEDEEEGEIFVSSSSDMIDEDGQPVPIANILSPVLLAGGTCVDSFFSPRLVPVLDLCLSCHQLQIRLLHNPPSLPGRFGDYEVAWQSNTPQELLKITAQHLTCHLKRRRNDDTTFQVDGQVSVDFVDFLDLSWRVGLHPTHVHLRLDQNHDTPRGGESQRVYAIDLKCSPTVVRLSQGLVHTLSLSLHIWGTDRRKEMADTAQELNKMAAIETNKMANIARELNKMATTTRDMNKTVVSANKFRGTEMAGMESKKNAAVLSHIILCNNTLQDLHFGQVSTDEVMVLRSGQCMGYSWRSTKISPQTLHLCFVTDGVWKWTKPFSVSGEGVHSVEVHVGSHTALVNVCISNIGGLQKTVTFTGNWTFSSSLPFPLHISLESTSHQESVHAPETDGATITAHETLLLPPESMLKSLVLPETLLSGVRVRSTGSNVWSELYPIHSTNDEWSKPQLLTEIEYCSGQRVNLWYNIKPLNTAKGEPIGSKVVFSPLFAVCNHLPFDLTMVAVETNATGPTPISLPECVVSGRGEKTILTGLLASTWYHLSFRQSGSGAVSEPAVSLSTFILVHLPFSTAAERVNDWPYDDDETQLVELVLSLFLCPTHEGPIICAYWAHEAQLHLFVMVTTVTTSMFHASNRLIVEQIKLFLYTLFPLKKTIAPLGHQCLSIHSRFDLSEVPATSSIIVSLPLVNGSNCCLHAVLERDPNNTITLHLQPDILVINHSSFSLKLVSGDTETETEREETASLYLPSEDIGVMPFTKFYMCAKLKGKSLISERLTVRPDETKEQQDQFTNVVLSETENGESSEGGVVSGHVTIVRHYRGSLLVFGIKSTFVFHNNTPYDLEISNIFFHYTSNERFVNCDQTEQLLASVVERVSSQVSRSLILCSHGCGYGTMEERVVALLLRTADEQGEEERGEGDGGSCCWSIPLSSNFVRHSFALPHHKDRATLRAVLTMHEHSGTTYMVASLDPSPRLLLLNNTPQNLEVVEEGTIGIHSVPQLISASRETVYEPPTFAKQYPLVADQESEKGLHTQKKIARVALKFRLHTTEQDLEEEESANEGWSEPYQLTNTSDHTLSIPGREKVLLSTERIGPTLQLSLLPTGGQEGSLGVSPVNVSDLGVMNRNKAKMEVEIVLDEVVVCVEDEITEEFDVQEVLQIVVNSASICINDSKESRSFQLMVESFHVNNMLEGDKGDFAVTVIPRSHHFRRASLIDSEPPPLASLSLAYNPHFSNVIKHLNISVQPLTLQLEDNLLNRIKSMLTFYTSPGTLRPSIAKMKRTICSEETPEVVLAEAERDVVPLVITHFVIKSTGFYLNARISLRVLLSCNDSPFRFSRYELQHVYSNWSELSQTVTSRYIMSIIAHVGWLVGSLELIGSPGTLLQNIGRGLRDLVILPYQGLTRSPSWFLLGIGQGTMSFVTHLSSGALGSITSMASSISHNMERLSLDPHHISYQTQQRQERPATHFTTGLISGASSLGLSLMSAVAGIVEQPMQSYHQIDGPATPGLAAKSILKGVGKGLLGVVTKPVGGVMELVSQTGQGLMHGTGLASRMCHRPVKLQGFTGSFKRTELQCSSTACAIKLGEELLFATTVTYSTPTATIPALLLITTDRLHLYDPATDTLQQTFVISNFTLMQHDSPAGDLEHVELEIVVVQSRLTGTKEDEEVPGFHKVEYFLRESFEKRSSVESSFFQPVIPPLPAASNLDCSNHNLELSMAPADWPIAPKEAPAQWPKAPEEAPAQWPKAPEGAPAQWPKAPREAPAQWPKAPEEAPVEWPKAVKLTVPTHHAVQLLSLFNSLSSLSLNPTTIFPIHRTVKSESFMSATSK